MELMELPERAPNLNRLLHRHSRGTDEPAPLLRLPQHTCRQPITLQRSSIIRSDSSLCHGQVSGNGLGSESDAHRAWLHLVYAHSESHSPATFLFLGVLNPG